ncbi:hypothetical protein [Mesorhizobium huakuii]|nr:hypothetical protein [Mesorhizobium huakuii]
MPIRKGGKEAECLASPSHQRPGLVGQLGAVTMGEWGHMLKH